MSYQVLARKYRPKSFQTLVGQEHVVRALTHALDSQRLHHAYLFTGTRGVGKTTLSRILAKSLNCETGITSRPCGVCDACIAIDAGRFVDYIEMDAASNRGVDEMAQLLEQAVYAPSSARFKVYMIDEVHMLSNHAFNSMLKTLEEPPEHVKFILATTDPQKIPVTVLSRCLQFNLKQMPPGLIIGHLESILAEEKIAYEIPGLRLLAQGAHGSMRDALSLTDQAIAYAGGKVTLAAVQGMLGALDQSYLVRLLDALVLLDGAALLMIADEMAARSLSYNVALQDLGSLLHRIALAQTVPATLAEDVPEREDIMRLADVLEIDQVQLYYQIAVHGRNELELAPDEYAGFSMTLLRMLAFHPDTVNSPTPPAAPVMAGAKALQHGRAPTTIPASGAAINGASGLTAVRRGTSSMPALSLATTAPPIAHTAIPAGSSPARAALAAARMPKSTPSMGGVSALNAMELAPPWEEEPKLERSLRPPHDLPYQAANLADHNKSWQPEEDSRPVLASVAAASRVELSVTEKPSLMLHPVPTWEWDGNWPVLAATLPIRGVAQQLALQAELVKCQYAADGAEFHLRVPIETLRSAVNIDKLAVALSERFDCKVRLSTELGAVQHTASALVESVRVARQQAADAIVENDPFVQSLQRELGAIIVPGSIKPVD